MVPVLLGDDISTELHLVHNFTCLKCFGSYHVMVGFGLPTHRHSNVILVPSSDCLMTGLSVNVGLI